MHTSRIRMFETALLTALCLALCVGTWAQGRQAALSGRLVRLHVIADSDEGYEQALKLRVRDAVLDWLEPQLAGIEDSAAAREIISSGLEGIARAAAQAAEGRGVSVTLSREDYPTRQYEGFALPAGEYDSLRVVIGEGQGRNWWCVVFPPLCTASASDEQVLAAMSGDDYGIITESEGYELRFRTLELWGELKALLSGDGS